VSLTAGIVVADVVGAGILGMAPAIARLGWGLGTVAVVLCLAMNMHIALMLWRVVMKCPDTKTLVGLTAAVFADAPEGQRKGAMLFAGFAQYAFLFLLLCLYTLTVGKSIGMLMYDVRACLPIWTLVGCLIILPLNMSSRTLGAAQSLVWLNCSTICGTVIIPLVYMMVMGVDSSRPASSEMAAVKHGLSFSDVLTSGSTFAFAFTGQFINVEIISEMKDPAEFPKAYLWMSAPFQLVAFLAVGLGGCYYKGDSITGMITDNIPFGICFRISCMCLLTHMLITYIIKAIVTCRGIHYCVNSKSLDDSSRHAWTLWALIVTTVMAAAWIVSQLIPFFEDFINLAGASLTPAGNWILPILLYVKCFGGSAAKGQGISRAEWGLIIVELSVSAVLMVAGTYVAGGRIGEHWHTYGGPFGCHCEHMWNTCECSATHAGLEGHCLAPPLPPLASGFAA